MTEVFLEPPTREPDIRQVYEFPSGTVSSRYNVWLPQGEEDGYVISSHPNGEEPLGGMATLAAYAEHKIGLAGILKHAGLASRAARLGNKAREAQGSFPSVPTLIKRLAEIEMPEGHELPTFEAFHGLRYKPSEGLEAIAEGSVLLATEATIENGDFAAVHDMYAHVPTWCALPPVVRNNIATFAQKSLRQSPRESVAKAIEADAMQRIDLAVSCVGIGAHLFPQETQGPFRMQEEYRKRLRFPQEEARVLTDATLKHVALLGELALPNV